MSKRARSKIVRSPAIAVPVPLRSGEPPAVAAPAPLTLVEPAGKGACLVLCLPQVDLVRAEYANSLACMMLRLGYDHAGIDQVVKCNASGSILPHVRQQLAEAAIIKGATHLLWIDSDHSFPVDTPQRLLAHRRPIVGINASTRKMPVRATALKKRGERLETTPQSTGLERVLSMGFGIAMIEARVFLAMEKPWFNVVWVEDETSESGHTFRGEDYYFCEKARAAGFQPMIDQDLTKETAHYGSIGWNTALMKARDQAESDGGRHD